MSTTITRVDESETTAPLGVDGYSAGRESGNIVHRLLGGGVAVTVRPSIPRSGTLRLYYATEADAKAAADMHALVGSFELSTTDRPTIDMVYVVADSTTIELDGTRLAWVVSVPFQEVS